MLIDPDWFWIAQMMPRGQSAVDTENLRFEKY